jgi:hypothetical protein
MYKDAPVKSAGDRTIFSRVFGALHTIDNAMVTAPAARRRKSKTAQTPINFLETIVIAL